MLPNFVAGTLVGSEISPAVGIRWRPRLGNLFAFSIKAQRHGGFALHKYRKSTAHASNLAQLSILNNFSDLISLNFPLRELRRSLNIHELLQAQPPAIDH